MKRILLKLSGEALAGAKKTGFDEETVIAVSRQDVYKRQPFRPLHPAQAS